MTSGYLPKASVRRTCKPVIHAPVFIAVRVDEHVQAATVGQLVRLVFGLGLPGLNIGEWRCELGHDDGVRFDGISRHRQQYR